jgi:hypothetical protein
MEWRQQIALSSPTTPTTNTGQVSGGNAASADRKSKHWEQRVAIAGQLAAFAQRIWQPTGSDVVATGVRLDRE